MPAKGEILVLGRTLRTEDREISHTDLRFLFELGFD